MKAGIKYFILTKVIEFFKILKYQATECNESNEVMKKTNFKIEV